MYSWAGQLYTALRTEYQLIKRISAGLTGFSVEKIAYRGRKKLLDFVHEFWGRYFFAHELHEFSCKRVQNRTIALSQKTKENLFALAWREIALLRRVLVHDFFCPRISLI